MTASAELQALRALAGALGVYTEYVDGLRKPVTVAPETLVRVCAALGADIARPGDAAAALRAQQAAQQAELLPPVLVAWDGVAPPLAGMRGELVLDTGTVRPVPIHGTIPFGYHRLAVEAGGAGRRATSTLISAPVATWRRPGDETRRSWGVGAQLAALRSSRSRAIGELTDLETLCRWVRGLGGDLVTLLPLLPTFNGDPPEPSPYSSVSRLFWSELVLSLDGAAPLAAPPATLDVTRAEAEVRAALAGHPAPADVDAELARYARFRGAQARLGRNWRAWPEPARRGELRPEDVDPDEERFHLVAQTLARRQLGELRERLERDGMRLGLDLAVGGHPDGYDPWSRQALFGDGMSVGAPPDQGFPSGQDWGFSPVLPAASRREGHRYLAACIAHQASVAGVLRIDHIMAWTRLYWIPHGMGLHEGTYVAYPADELFAVLTLESYRHHCEIVGENLGTVPPEMDAALTRHRIWGMFLAEFEASSDAPELVAPTARDVAYVGTHDTPTFAGWLSGVDIGDRVRYHLLEDAAVPAVRAERAQAAARLARHLQVDAGDPRAFRDAVLAWLGRSASPLVIAWLEDLWLEEIGVNLPGTRSSERPNWQRPMQRLLDAVVTDPAVADVLRRLHDARNAHS